MLQMKYPCLFLLISFFFSCSPNKAFLQEDSVEFTLLKRIEFPLDERTYYSSMAVFQFEDKETGKEYLSFENNKMSQHEILFYDIEKQELQQRVPVYKEGPNTVYMFGHYPVSLNEIYITGDDQTITVINEEGEIKQRYSYIQTNEEEPVSIYYSTSVKGNHLIIVDSVLYITQSPLFGDIGEDDWKNIPLCANINMKTKAVGKPPITYPVLFKKKTFVTNTMAVDFSSAYDNRSFIYAFCQKDSIIVTEDHEIYQLYNAKSRYLKNAKIDPTPAGDIYGVEKASCEEEFYQTFFHDKYRDVYYRFAYLPCQLEPNDNPITANRYRREFTIIVMNKNFEIIGETKFPKDVYYPQMSFIGRDGLYICRNNPKNPDFNEDKLIFDCFTIN